MTYSVKEIYFTVQGEGVQTGLPAIFLRFSGCNLWSGLERDRETAICKFCDTDFVGTDGPRGGKFATAEALVQNCLELWPTGKGQPWVVVTGGEPLLQLDPQLIQSFHKSGFKVAVETNGTIAAPAGIDWLCVSPKADTEIVQTTGNELKLVFPQDENHPELFETLDFDNFMLQPKDDKFQAENMKAAFEFCLKNPRWRLSLQTHKWIGVP